MFPGPSLLSAITAVLESALEQALSLDPAGRASLLAALEHPVRLDISTPLAMSLQLEQSGGKVRVSGHPDIAPGVTLTGGPAAMAALAVGDRQVLDDGRLSINGKAEQARQLQQALARLDPDWEAAMARHLGDVPAHFLGSRIRGLLRWSREAANSMTANIEEYLHEESRTLPGRRELEANLQEIQQLEQQAERLQARLDALDNTGSEQQTENL